MKRLAVVAATSALAMALAAGGTVAQGHGQVSGGDHRSHDEQVCGLDKQWLQSSIQGDRFEIQGGQLALSKTSAPKVQKLAHTLIDDHTQSLSDAIDLAHKYDIEVPDSPSPVQQWILGDLAKSGRDFDQAYSSVEVADHVQDISEAQEEVQDGCNQDIRDEAKNEIPTLQYHLQLAEEALASVSS